MNKLIGASMTVLLAASAPAIAAPPPLSRVVVAAVASPERPAEDRVRDADRKPAELLAFAGIRPGWKVVELAPGGGYFTRLLSLAVGERGYVYTSTLRPSPAVTAWAQAHANVSLAKVVPGEVLAPEPVDLVWTTQNYHDFRYQMLAGSDGPTAPPSPR